MKALTVPSNYKITKEFVAAVLAENMACAEDCLNSGADINAPLFPCKATALGHSARQGKTDLVNLLLKYKPDIDAENKYGNTPPC